VKASLLVGAIFVVILITPEAGRSNLDQDKDVCTTFVVRTRECRNILRRVEVSCEKLIRPGDSWFSAKSI